MDADIELQTLPGSPGNSECIFRRVQVLILFLAVWLFATDTTSAQPAGPAESPDGASDSGRNEPASLEAVFARFKMPTLESVTASIAAINNDRDMSEDERKSLLDLYQTAEKSLTDADRIERATQDYRRLILLSTNRMDELKALLADPPPTNSPAQNAPNTVSDKLDQDELREATEQADAKLAALRKEKATITAAADELQSRPERNARLRTDARSVIDSAATALSQESENPAPGGIGAARVAAWMARQVAARGQLALAELQETGRQTEVGINDLARQLNSRELARAERIATELKNRLDGQTAAAARETELAAVRAERDARMAHPLIQTIATTNTYYAARLNEVIDTNRRLSSRLAEIEAGVEHTGRTFTNLTRQFKITGLSSALTQLLVGERRKLPTLRDLTKSRNALQETFVTNAIENILITSRLDQLKNNLESVAETTLADDASVAAGQKDALKAELLQHLRLQLEVLEELQLEFGSMEDTIRELEIRQTEQIKLVADFRQFIDQRLLWTPTVPPLHWKDFNPTLTGIQHLANPDNWADVGLAMMDTFTETPLLTLLVALFPPVMLFFRPRVTQFLGQIAERTRKIRTDNFALTLRALMVTLIELAPYYVFAIHFGGALRTAEGATPFVASVGFALKWVFELIIPFILILGICRRNGLAREHFKWQPATIALVRSYAAKYMIVAFLCFFVVAIFVVNPDAAAMLGVARVCYMISTMVLTFYIWRIFHPRTGRLWPTFDASTFSVSDKARFAWFVMLLLAPATLTVLAIAGYLYAALQLSYHLNLSFLLMLVIGLIYQLARRWFLIRQRMLALEKELQRRREAALAAQEPEEEQPSETIQIEEPVIDLQEIQTQTLKLMRFIAGLAILSGLWMIWKEVVPALNYLDNFELWNSTKQVHGISQQVPVTLADLMMAGVILIAALVGYRNLPGVLDAIILQNIHLRPGSRYAIASVSQYVLIVVAGSVLLTRIGVNWSQLGWMAAALSVGLGFGLQEIVANFVCGLLLFMERPIRVGDVVTVSDVSGTVVRIQIRATTVMDWERREFIVPNKEFISGRVLNWTLSSSINRIIITVGVAYGTDTRRACDILVEAAEEHPEILKDPPPFAIFEEFADSSLSLTLRCYLPNLDKRLSTQHQLRTAIDEKFKAAGIEIPFPQRDLHLRSVSPGIGPVIQEKPTTNLRS